MRSFSALCGSFAVLAATLALGHAAATNIETKTELPKPAQPYPVTAIVVSNTITFPILLSRHSEPLMTNAVFHRTFGRKVIFGEDLSVEAYDYEKLHPSVLAQLNLDPDKLKADQEALNQRYQLWAEQFQKGVQQFLTSEATSAAGASTATDADATNSTATNATHHHLHFRHYRSSAGKSAPKTTTHARVN